VSSGLQRFFRCAMFIYSFSLCYSLSLYPFTERYAQPYFFSCLIRQDIVSSFSSYFMHVILIRGVDVFFRPSRYNGLLYEEGCYNYGIRAEGFETIGSKDLTCEDWMVNTRTDADLSAAVQNALQTLLPQIRAEIREEFRTSSGPSDSGENPTPVTIHTWLERFNKQKPRSFEKATAPVDAE
nr:hypothetical protein [Tanacetum cinerariifolium]